MADLEYEAAAEDLMRAAAAADATDEQRLQAHLLAGIANRILGRDVDARLNFRSVLLAAPQTRLPEGTSPKVLSFFETVRQEVELERRAPRADPRPEPKPDNPAEPLTAQTRGLIAGGVTGGVGLLTLPLCAYCGQGLCLLCPGTAVAAVAGLAGGMAMALMAQESLADHTLTMALAAVTGVLVTAVVGGAMLATMMIASPVAAATIGNGALSPLEQGLTTGAGVLAAVLAGVGAGAVAWWLAPADPMPTPSATPSAAPPRTAMAF